MSAPSPGRKVVTSPLRRIAQCVLAAGCVLSFAAAFGPIWVVRSGIALAVIAGIVACVLGWREVAAARVRHQAKLLEVARAQSETLSRDRQHNVAVLDTLQLRFNSATEVIEKQRVRIGELTSEVSTLHGDNAFLKGEVMHRDSTINSLRETISARMEELRALTGAEDDDAEVMALPRRVRTKNEWDALPSADDLWKEGTHPTVVDLRTLETALVLPNFESDERRLEA